MNDLRSLQQRMNKLKGNLREHQVQEHDRAEVEETGNLQTSHAESPPTGNTTTSISNHNEWMMHIGDRGHQPEDWLEFLVFLRDKAPFSNAKTKYPFVVNVYAKAIKCICSKEPKKNEAFAQLLIDAAQYRQREDEMEARKMFKCNRSLARRFAFYHVAYAQFELDYGNRDKCKKILDWAKEANAEPKELLFIAFQKFLSNKSPLVTWEDLQRCNTGMYQNYTGELSTSLIRRMGSFSEELRFLESATVQDVPCTPHLHNKSNNTAPQLSLSSFKINGDGLHHEDMLMSSSKQSSCDDNSVSFKGVSEVKNNSGKHPGMRITPDQTSQSTGGQKHVLRSSHSTPDCKGPGILSGVSIGKSNFWRVARAGAAPSIRELRNAMVEEEEPEEGANTMEILNMHPLPPTPDKDADRVGGGSLTDQSDRSDSIIQGSTAEAPSTVKKSTDKALSLQSGLNSQNAKKELQYPNSSLSGKVSANSQTNNTKDSSSTNSSILASKLSASTSSTVHSATPSNNTNTEANSTAKTNVSTSSSSQASYPVKPVFAQPMAVDSHPGLPSVTKTSASRNMHHLGPNGNAQLMPSRSQPIYEMTPRKPEEVLVVNGIQYCILKLIGKGGSSKVYRVFDPEKNLKAVKCVNIRGADESIVESYMNEIDLLQKLRSNNWVIKLYDYEYDEEKCILYLVMEVGETDLANHLRNLKKSMSTLPIISVKNYWMNMLEAVRGLHSQGIVHADLKPANFVLVAGMLKLIDFGIAKAVPQDKTSVFQTQAMGTLNYMSPEAMMDVCGGAAVDENGRPCQQYKVSVKSDVWSLGCMLFFLVHGRTPFQHITNDILKLQAIANPNYLIQIPDGDDRHVNDVLKKCLLRDPKQRCSIEELLQHPFLKPEKKDTGCALTPRKKQVLQQVESIGDFSPGTIDTLLNVLKKRATSVNEVSLNKAVKNKLPLSMQSLENMDS